MSGSTIARIASGGRLGPEALPWHQLRYQHTQAIRQRLVEAVSERTGKPPEPGQCQQGAPAALRGVLREAWRLGLMSAEDLARATDLEPVRGSRPLRGRALEPHEVVVCPVGKGGRVELRRLAPQGILRVCEKRGREAGIAGFAAHDLRRTYVSTLLDQGVDLSLASDLAGHSSPTTTKRYDRRAERARHAAAAAVVVALS